MIEYYSLNEKKKDYNTLIKEIKKNRKLEENPYFKEFLSDYEMNQFTTEVIRNNSLDNYQPQPSNLRISTMTAICSIGINIDLVNLYESINIKENIDNYPFIKSCQYGNNNIKGGTIKKPRKKRNPSKSSKRPYFQNQVTFIILISQIRQVNLKIFRNGKIQMTGLKSKEEGIIACQKIISEIKKLNLYYLPNTTNETELINNFSIVLINSDFSGGFKIKRDKLYEILYNKKIFVSYEPDIYPGVNAKYYWNTSTLNTDNAGICKCERQCSGKGTGEGHKNCKKITIAIFQSGNIIITGARSNQQTYDAYNFINNILKENYENIVRISNNMGHINTLSIKNIKTKIPIDDIINPEVRYNFLKKMK